MVGLGVVGVAFGCIHGLVGHLGHAGDQGERQQRHGGEHRTQPEGCRLWGNRDLKRLGLAAVSAASARVLPLPSQYRQYRRK